MSEAESSIASGSDDGTADVVKENANTSRKKAVPRKKSTKLPKDSKDSKLAIKKAPFVGLITEIVQGFCPEFRFHKYAAHALHVAAEAYVTCLLEDAYMLTLHAKRVTIYPADVQLAKRIRGDPF